MEAFHALLTQNECWLRAYVYSLLVNNADADDLIQESKITMWRHFDRFELGTDFRAWAARIATNQVRNYRRSKKCHTTGGVLDEKFFDVIAAEIDRQESQLLQEAEALKSCVQKLPFQHQAVLNWRYYDGCEIEEVAARAGRSIEAVYRLLSRIRLTLGECIKSRIGGMVESP